MLGLQYLSSCNKGRARGTDQRKDRQARSNPHILKYGKGESIQTNLKEFTEQLAFVLGVEPEDAFNCVRLDEYFTYEGDPYQDAVVQYQNIMIQLDSQIADAASATEKRTLRERRAVVVTETEAALSAGRMEKFKMNARLRHQKQVKLDEDE